MRRLGFGKYVLYRIVSNIDAACRAQMYAATGDPQGRLLFQYNVRTEMGTKSKTLDFIGLACASVVCGSVAVAQDIVIRNARIIDGAGGALEQGTIAVEDGRITSVSAGDDGSRAPIEIDGRGMTVMPGFIDTHRHVIGGGDEPIDSETAMSAWLDATAPRRMREFLAAGFTTILSAGDPTAGILELKRRLDDSEIVGPQLLVSGDRIKPATAEEAQACREDDFCRANQSLFTDAEEARTVVRELADAGVDAVKIRLDGDDPTGVDEDMAAVIAEEAERQGVPSIVHATQVPNMIAAIEAGVTRLVHTPHTGTLQGTPGTRLALQEDTPVSTTLGVWVPIFSEDNEALWRNGAPFPAPGVARAGQGPVNARYLWDAGVLLAFGTDTRFHPAESLIHELRPLRLLFSPRDIIAMITRNAAQWLELDDELGTLEPGKVADIVLVAGNPLADVHDLADVEVVIKNGEVVQID